MNKSKYVLVSRPIKSITSETIEFWCNSPDYTSTDYTSLNRRSPLHRRILWKLTDKGVMVDRIFAEAYGLI